MSVLMDMIAEMDDKIFKQQEEITELVTAINLVYIANNTSKITGFNDLMAVVEKQNNGVFMSELSKLADIAAKCVDAGFNHESIKADEYEREINKQQTEIAEYKAFMLGLELSSEDEVRLMNMLAKHNKGELDVR